MKKIFIFSFLAFFLFSCEDAIEIVQDGELNDQALFKNVANLQLFMNEVYDRAATENDLITSSLLTDEVAIAAGLTTNDTQRFFMVSTNGNAAAIWNSHYQLINYCNRVIRGATFFTPSASELPQYNSILAQARALRAFAHFQLLTYFSQDISNDNALGVMKVDFVPTAQQDIPRSTNGEVFGLIESDLNFAQANLGTPFAGTVPVTAANSYKFVNVNFLNAFRARMYLYRKNYSQALVYADAVLSTSGVSLASCLFPSTMNPNFPATSATVVSLSGSTTINTAPTATNAQQLALWQMDQWTPVNAPAYRRMWVDAIQGESLFSLERPNNRTNFSSRYNTNGSYISGGPLYDMGRTLFDLYTQPLGGGAEDFRRWCFVDRSATISATPLTATRTNEQIVIDKYPGKTGSHTSNDVKVFRLSEMYFIKAECLARSGNLTGAALLIQQVRQARNYIVGAIVPLPVYANATAAYADILLERRKELSFEGHRYIDLKRLGADAGVTGTDRYSQDAINSSATSPVNINIGDYRFTLPIPQAEINVNALPQNPGY
jgi:starch-binding outer membrane protein, SusD/RagB family